jgi:transposase
MSISYFGKKVYVGMDVHKKTYAITAICDGVVVKKATLAANSEVLRTFFTNHFAGAEIICAYEAGFSGFHLQRKIVSWGCACLVVNPGSLEVAARDRVKTDKRDSLKIAEHIAHNRVKSIRIPGIETEESRMLSRSRSQFVEERSRAAVQIKSKLQQLGLMDNDDDRVMSRKYVEEIESLKVSSTVKFVLREFCLLWRRLDDQISVFDKKLAEQAQLDSKIEAVYRSVPGIGPVTSRVLANELGDMSQFENEDRLFSFVGLTPTENSSGEVSRKGHISRQGNPRIRHALLEIAWRAITKDEALRHVHERISCRAGAKRAIVAVARRIIGRIRACFCKNELWKLNFGSQNLAAS